MYGKTLENSRNSVDIRMVNNKIIFEIDIKIELHNTKIFDKDQIATHKINTTLILNNPLWLEPVYAGIK